MVYVRKSKTQPRYAGVAKPDQTDNPTAMVDIFEQYPGVTIDSLVDCMIESIKTTLLMEVETALDPVLQNKVCTVPLGMCEVKTSAIDRRCVHFKFRKREFPAHTTRHKNRTVLVFKRGKLVVNNVRTEEQMYYAILKAFQELRKIGALSPRHFLSVARTNNNVLTGSAVAAKSERCSVDLALFVRNTTR